MKIQYNHASEQTGSQADRKTNPLPLEGAEPERRGFISWFM